MEKAVAFCAIPDLNMANILKAAAKDTIATGIVILPSSQPGNTRNKRTPPTITTARFEKPNIIVLIRKLFTVEETHIAIASQVSGFILWKEKGGFLWIAVKIVKSNGTKHEKKRIWVCNDTCLFADNAIKVFSDFSLWKADLFVHCCLLNWLTKK